MSEKMFLNNLEGEASIENDFQEKLKRSESDLRKLAQIIGADFGMKVKFGELNKGSFFDTINNEITLDPIFIKEGKYYFAEFVAGHEGGHRAITRHLEQIGVSKEKANELYQKIGFSYLNNCIEDCADNSWVGKAFGKFKKSSDRVYTEQFKKDNVAMTTPEVNKYITMLGYTPKFVSYGSEIIRKWAMGKYNKDLDKDVLSAIEKTEKYFENAYNEIPGEYSSERQRIKSATERFRIIYEHILGEFEKLVKMDIDKEKLREMANQMMQDFKQNKEQSSDGSSSGESGDSKMSGELQKELEELANKNQKEVFEKIKEQIENGEKNIIPFDELSESAKQELQKMFDKLSDVEKKALEKKAKETLEELDDKLIEETRSKFDEMNRPKTHEELKKEGITSEGEQQKKEQDINDPEKIREQLQEDQKIQRKLKQQMENNLNKYDKIYKEISMLADEFYNRIHKVFLPQRHPQWQKGHPDGHRLDLSKVMQFEADRTLYDKIWERKTIPRQIDYRFLLLVDLSGSMSGEKIEQTFRGVMLASEVLNRLGIKFQLMGFQDDIIKYKDFSENLNPEIRKNMTIMLREVSNQGIHNCASHNSDGYCLEQSSNILNKNNGKDNFLIVFSDGLPAPDSEHNTIKYDLSNVVNRIRKTTKQKLIGIGLGRGTEHVARYYPTSLPNITIEDLPKLLGNLLEDMIKYPAKYN